MADLLAIPHFVVNQTAIVKQQDSALQRWAATHGKVPSAAVHQWRSNKATKVTSYTYAKLIVWILGDVTWCASKEDSRSPVPNFAVGSVLCFGSIKCWSLSRRLDPLKPSVTSEIATWEWSVGKDVTCEFLFILAHLVLHCEACAKPRPCEVLKVKGSDGKPILLKWCFGEWKLIN